MQGQQQRALRWQARGAATRRAPRGSVLRRAAARPLVVVAKKSVETIRVESGASNNTLLGHWRQMAGMDTTVVPVEPGVHLAGLHEHVSVNMEGIPVPINTHGVGKAGKYPPFIGKVLSVKRLGGRDRERDVIKIVIDTGGVPYVEGQAFGVVPPGWKRNSRGKQVPFGTRLYSIASSRYGDSFDGKTCTLCVVRVVWRDSETGKMKRGVCSNYLHYVKPGDEIQMTGPCGHIMLLPDDALHRPIVCVATGTGIAPFRSYWRRLFYDQVPGQPQGYQSKFWLLTGFANQDSKLFADELEAVAAAYPDNMRWDCALSLEQTSARGEPLYVQDLIEQNADEWFRLMMGSEAVFFFCGLKRMYAGVRDTLERLGAERGVDVQARIKELQAEHRWHVETA